MRARRRIERRLDVRQRGELDRQPALGEDAAHVALPAALPDQAGAELVGLAELEAHLAGGARAAWRPRRRSGTGPARAAPRRRGCCAGRSRGAAARPGSARGAGAGSAPGRAARRLARQAHRLVDEREVLAVVQQPAAGVHLAVDALPELDARHQRRRLREVGLPRRERAAAPAPGPGAGRRSGARRRSGPLGGAVGGSMPAGPVAPARGASTSLGGSARRGRGGEGRAGRAPLRAPTPRRHRDETADRRRIRSPIGRFEFRLKPQRPVGDRRSVEANVRSLPARGARARGALLAPALAPRGLRLLALLLGVALRARLELAAELPVAAAARAAPPGRSRPAGRRPGARSGEASEARDAAEQPAAAAAERAHQLAHLAEARDQVLHLARARGRCRARCARRGSCRSARAARAPPASSTGSWPASSPARARPPGSAISPMPGSLPSRSRSEPMRWSVRSWVSRSSMPKRPRQHALGVGLGLLRVHHLLEVAHQADHVAHAEDARGEAFGAELLEPVHALAGADELDGDAGHGLHRERGAAARVAVELGEHQPVERRAARRRRAPRSPRRGPSARRTPAAGSRARWRPRSRAARPSAPRRSRGGRRCRRRRRRSLPAARARARARTARAAPRRARPRARARRSRRRGVWSCCTAAGPLHVGRHQQRAPALLLEMPRQLRGDGGLADALEAEQQHRDDAVRARERGVHRAHQRRELLLAARHEVLARASRGARGPRRRAPWSRRARRATSRARARGSPSPRRSRRRPRAASAARPRAPRRGSRRTASARRRAARARA